MSNIVIPGPSTFVVKWGCRRCGHKTGVARTTVPIVNQSTSEPEMRELLASLRRKLVRLHQDRQGCIATVEDFTLQRATEEEARIVGLI